MIEGQAGHGRGHDHGHGLAELFDVTFEGLAVVDRHGRYVRVNPVGCDILGAQAAALEGTASFLRSDDGKDAVTGVTRLGSPNREIEYRCLPRRDPDPGGTVVAFREVTGARVRERQFAAFARAAESVAFGGSLRSTLDMICDEIVRSTGLAAAQILLIGENDLRLQVHGAAPTTMFPPDFTLRLDEARQRGAQLKSLLALQSRRPVVAPYRKAEMLASKEWQPLHEHFTSFEWDSFASAPLVFHGRPIGALNAYYRPGHDPTEADVAFARSMADQAAVAVQNARLIAESTGRAALDERHRLARDLHDSACQELFSLTLELRAATRALDRGRLTDPASIRDRLTVLDQLAHTALSDMRELIYELHPSILHTEGLVAALCREAESITAREGLRVRISAPEERLTLDASVELDLYRLAKEALHNAVKHADPSTVEVEVGECPTGSGTLVVEVVDDGVGFDPRARSAGLGLISMRERAAEVGGQLTLTSRSGGGTRIRVVAPGVLRGTATEEARW